MQRTLLLTRPEADSLELAAVLETRGHTVLIDPALDIEPVPAARVDLAGVQAVVLTSRHAVVALAQIDPSLPVFCVGEATATLVAAKTARRASTGPGDASGLARLIAQRLRPDDGAVLHLAGDEVRPELRAYLEDHGFHFRQLVVYRARAAARLRPTTLAALGEGRIDAVLSFSPRSAAVFMALARKADLSRVTALCLSSNVAAALEVDRFAGILIAKRPDQAALLDLLEAPAVG